MSLIGVDADEINLNTHREFSDPDANVNDGSPFTLSTYRQDAANAGKVVPIFFINIDGASVGGQWLAMVHAVAGDPELRPVVVCFRHDGTDYVDITSDLPIYHAITDNGVLTEDDFSTIPVLRDDDGSVSEYWLDGILTDTDDYGDSGPYFNDSIGTDRQMWAYIIDTEGKVSDKWHHDRIDDPLAVALCLPSGTSWPHGDIGTWPAADLTNLTTAISTRCENLRSALTVLDDHVDPSESSVLSSFPGSIGIPLSRPLDTIGDPSHPTDPYQPSTDPSYWTLSGGAVSAGAGNPSAVGYVGSGFITNTVTLTFSGAALSDTDGWDMAVEFPGIRDASGNFPDGVSDPTTDAFGLAWNVSTSAPSITGGALANTANLVSGTTVGEHPILVDISFSEALPAQPANLVTVSQLPGSSNAPSTTTFTHTADEKTGRLTINLADDSEDGAYRLTVASGGIVDGAGVTNTASWTMDITYDAEAPQPVFTNLAVAQNGTTTNSIVTFSVDYQEDVTGHPDPGGASPGISASQGTLSYLGGGPQEFNYSLTLDSPGSVSVSVAAGAVTDLPLGRDAQATAADYTFTYAPSFKNVVLVVDISGSMGWDIPFDSGSGPVDTPKWSVIKPRIQTFLTRMNIAVGAGTVNGTEDLLALITYNATAHQADLGGDPWCESDAVGDAADPGDLDDAIAMIHCGGDTAMGDAIRMAHTLLDAATGVANRDGSVILFADGQNCAGTEVSLQGDPPDRFDIGDPGDPPLLTVNKGSAPYPIYAIGIHTELATAESWLPTLASIADISGGTYHDVTEVDLFPDTEDALAGIMTAIYGGNSPVRVTSLYGTIPPGQSEVTIPFVLDDDSSGLMVSLSWPGTENAAFLLRNGTTVLRQFNRKEDGRQHSVASLMFPHVQRAFDLRPPVGSFGPIRHVPGAAHGAWRAASGSPGALSRFSDRFDRPTVLRRDIVIRPPGDWSVTVRRRGGNATRPLPFYLAVLSEEPLVVPEVSLTPGPIYTGAPFDAALLLKGERLSVIDASLSVEYCPVSLANIVAEKAGQYPGAAVKFRPTATGKPQLTKELSKKRLLSRFLVRRDAKIADRPEVRAALSRRGFARYAPTNLRTTAKGVLCRWRLKGFTVPGHHRLVFRIEGRSAKTGRFQRIVTRSIVVLPSLDIKKSVVSYTLNPVTKWFEAVVIPQDNRGNRLGPGYSEVIKAPSCLEQSLSVVDRLDGSYLVSGRLHSVVPGRTPRLALGFRNPTG